MTYSEAKKEITESGIGLGAGDFVDVEALKVAADALEKVQAYEALGTVEELRELKEKAEPKKPTGKWIFKNDGAYGKRRAYCSACGKRSGIGGIESNQKKPYCPNCGAEMRV